MKALILAGGRGRRMEELSETENKCMLSLHGKPLIEYSLENAAAVDEIDEIVIVVGYRGETIVATYGNDYQGRAVSYVWQEEQKGVVDAMQCAAARLDGDDFFLFLADEVILGGRHREMLAVFQEERLFCLCGVYPQADLNFIKRTYSLISGPDNRICRLIEKPRKPLNHLMGTGNIVFRGSIFNYAEFTPINPHRGEKELPDLIQCAIDDGKTVKLFHVCRHYINVNSPEEWKMVESRWPEQPSSE